MITRFLFAAGMFGLGGGAATALTAAQNTTSIINALIYGATFSILCGVALAGAIVIAHDFNVEFKP